MATAPTPSAASGGTTKPAKSTTKKVTKAGATKPKNPRKSKKPGTTKSLAANTSQQAYAAARAAQMDLARIRNDEAARRLDPLWYKAEDILPSVADETVMSENAKFLPEQIKIVENALEKNNLSRSDVTPQAFACLLEQARRYAMEILTDSQDYAFVAGRTEIDRADLMLANEFRPDHPISVSTQLPKLNLLAQTVNRIPLPPIPTHCYSGVLLPPKNHQLTARTFDVVTSAQTARRMVQAAPPPPHKIKTNSKKAPSGKDDKSKPSYGAARGRQIAVKLKKKEEPKKTEETKKPNSTEETRRSEESNVETRKEAVTLRDLKETPKTTDEGKSVSTTASIVSSTAPKATDLGTKKEDDDVLMDVDNEKEPDLGAPSTTSDAIKTEISAPSSGADVAAKSETDDARAPAEMTKDEGEAIPMDTSPTKS
ncbi:transcription initiation factor IID, 31kD subunit [Nitzschia inconspicua]|uniref:Transcription initiation factor IID, 31kD subunit n=1 Tax=Nitzschia inconspicua TaxID=303405 RepID=A0A9K3PVV3_9STRA|nr:transcription initiation factor IID, 31kD subunit [Nitzschia inconspicua]